ncbi:hypothetical protein GA829_16870 [Mesorhizobium sp. INR15]|nr:hypothetical protein GA829_16870 [Mesorhizobium sp. INR15]
MVGHEIVAPGLEAFTKGHQVTIARERGLACPRGNCFEVTLDLGAAPHPPAGTFSPYNDGEKGEAPALTPPSPRLYTGRG